MAYVAGVFLFRMSGDSLWVNERALGTQVERIFRDRTVRLRIPAPDDEFALEGFPLVVDAFPGDRTSYTWTTEAAVAVDVVQVAVYKETTFGSADFKAEGNESRTAEASETLRELFSVAQAFLKHVVDQTRLALDQYWLGPTTDPPEQAMQFGLVDTETRERIPVLVGVGRVSPAGSLETSVTAEALGEIADRACEESEIPLPEELLADARYHARIRQPPDYRFAALLAAIASESKVKHNLAELAEPAVEQVVRLFLQTNPVHKHFDVTAAAVVGRSLRQEDRELYDAVERMFETRNKIAHGKPEQPGEEAMREAVKTTEAVFEWLRSL